jgi:hypothetical protein
MRFEVLFFYPNDGFRGPLRNASNHPPDYRMSRRTRRQSWSFLYGLVLSCVCSVSDGYTADIVCQKQKRYLPAVLSRACVWGCHNNLPPPLCPFQTSSKWRRQYNTRLVIKRVTCTVKWLHLLFCHTFHDAMVICQLSSLHNVPCPSNKCLRFAGRHTVFSLRSSQSHRSHLFLRLRLVSTGYGLDDQGVGVRVPVGARIITFPCLPDRLWGLPSLLSNWYRKFFPWG